LRQWYENEADQKVGRPPWSGRFEVDAGGKSGISFAKKIAEPLSRSASGKAQCFDEIKSKSQGGSYAMDTRSYALCGGNRFRNFCGAAQRLAARKVGGA
jgi:hypothetical protein